MKQQIKPIISFSLFILGVVMMFVSVMPYKYPENSNMIFYIFYIPFFIGLAFAILGIVLFGLFHQSLGFKTINIYFIIGLVFVIFNLSVFALYIGVLHGYALFVSNFLYAFLPVVDIAFMTTLILGRNKAKKNSKDKIPESDNI